MELAKIRIFQSDGKAKITAQGDVVEWQIPEFLKLPLMNGERKVMESPAFYAGNETWNLFIDSHPPDYEEIILFLKLVEGFDKRELRWILKMEAGGSVLFERKIHELINGKRSSGVCYGRGISKQKIRDSLCNSSTGCITIYCIDPFMKKSSLYADFAPTFTSQASKTREGGGVKEVKSLKPLSLIDLLNFGQSWPSTDPKTANRDPETTQPSETSTRSPAQVTIQAASVNSTPTAASVTSSIQHSQNILSG